MILTVTANPSVDLTMSVGHRPCGDVQRARSTLVEPSGKGVNVAVALHRTDHPVLAVVPFAAGQGADLRAMLASLGLACAGVEVAGRLRTNVSLIEADGTTSKVNELGAALSPDEAESLVELSLSRSRAGDWVAWCGSLPGGLDAERLGDAVAEARAAGRRVVVDTSQTALAQVLGRPAAELPQVIKPNAEELAELTGRELHTLAEVTGAAQQLVEQGIETVLVSLGADGAVLVDRTGALHGTAPAVRVVNTAGAGDAFLAGYLGAGEDVPPADRLSAALQFGASAVSQAGTLFAPPAHYAATSIGAVDPRRPLSSPALPPDPTL